ncbi:MAG: hypothetical protein ACOZNI_35495 [Myxococcota bacterium]
MRRILVVANQTLFGEPLRDAIREELDRGGPAIVTVLVPAVDAHPGALVWDEHRSWGDAEARMKESVAELSKLGVAVEGRVGGHDALAASLDALRGMPDYDVVIVSTLPPGLSRWLGMDLPTRLHRLTGLRVRHVVGEPALA